MLITKLSVFLCNILNKINPRSKEENIVIQYGFELILDNLVKLIFIVIAGILLGKGLETLIVLVTFCTLRLQAGGIHAKTNIGCGLGMLFVWGLSLVGNMLLKIQEPLVALFYIISFGVIVSCAPMSKNIIYFTRDSKIKKKLTSVALLTFFMLVAFLNSRLREVIVYPVIMEVLTLLPGNKFNMKGDSIREENYCRKITKGS